MKRTLVDAGTLTKEQLKRRRVVVAPVGGAIYITEGKEYKIFKNNGIRFYISVKISDNLNFETKTLCLFKSCAHLISKNWLVYKYEN